MKPYHYMKANIRQILGYIVPNDEVDLQYAIL